MIFPMFAVYGIGQSVDGHVVLVRQPSAPAVEVKFPAALSPLQLGLHGRPDLFVFGDPVQVVPNATALLAADTDPPDQGELLAFGVAPDNGASLVMPLDDGRFVVAAGIFIYINAPEAEEGGQRIQVAGLSAGGAHNVVAISRAGSTIRVLYATRGNGAKHAYLLSFDLGSPPFSAPVDLTAGPQYTATVDWPYVQADKYNWYTGLLPHVMGAFDYCVFRNADRSSDGTSFLFVGVAIGAPFADGGQVKMSGYQVARGSGEASFDTFTAGGTLAGTVLTAQDFVSSPICTSTDMVGAATSINPDDYYFDELVSTLLLSFETPPVRVFWTNMRQAVETV